MKQSSPYDLAAKFVDKFLEFVGDYDEFHQSEVIEKFNLAYPGHQIAFNLRSSFITLVTDRLKYFEFNPNLNQRIKLTELGRRVKKAGGQQKYEELNDRSIRSQPSIYYGDVIKNFSGTIINKSVLSNSLNRFSHDEQSLAVLKEITSIVESSGNIEAKDNIEAFHEEIVKPNPKKSILTSLWNGATKALPSLLDNSQKVIGIIEKIVQLHPPH